MSIEIDEGLYSRQMFVYGESMNKICNANVLIINVNALGVEVAKNLILSGIKRLDVLAVDETITNIHLDSNMYVTSEDVGKQLAEVVVPRLRELNPYVTVNVVDSITNQEIKQYQAVVNLDKSFEQQREVNNVCRKYNVPYISGNTYGLTGVVFNDFGENFPVHDTTGENIKEANVARAYIQESDDGIKWIVETGDNHDMSPNEYLILHNTQTKESAGPYKIQDTTRDKDGSVHTLYLTHPDDNPTLEFVPDLFNSYGEMREVKQTQYFKFKTLKDSLKEPTYANVFYEHMERQNTLHALYQMLSRFHHIYSYMPKPFDESDRNKFVQLNKDETYIKHADMDTDVLDKFLNHPGIISAVVSVIGSIVSQEVLKAVTNKYTPIHQYMYFESFDSLPDFISVEDHSFSPDLSRYGYMTNVFGKDFIKNMMNLNMFMVGCGAIGCELLKNFAMMGVSCGEGTLTITDPDTIERSNLNRQFLFRSHNIGQFKSEAAANAIKEMNPDINIAPRQDKVGSESEDIYNFDFYSKQNIIANALDNVHARTYVDNKCVENGLPLLESGTLGVKGNVQVVVPHKSESYSSSSDPPEKDIPVCTLKNFPSHINHTSQWARDLFEGLFVNAPNNINMYNTNPEFLTKLSPAELELTALNLNRYGVSDVPKSTSDTIIVAIKHFNHYFNDTIIELLRQYPPDSKTSSGVPFWSGSKRCPQPIEFNPENDLHVEFVKHFAHLYANVYSLNISDTIDKKSIETLLKYHSDSLTYPVTEKFAANEEEEKANQEAKQDTSEDTLSSLDPAKFSLKVNDVVPAEFEKDDDTNHHIDFISTVANLRASNYHIPTADRHKIKGIVGRIIPAVATTTSLVAGLVALELCKFVAGHSSLNKFRNTFVNLGISFMAFSEPMPAPVQKLNDREYTMWDQLDIQSSSGMTMKQFRDKVKDFYGCDVDTVSYDIMSLYRSYANTYVPADRDKETMDNVFKLMNVPIQDKPYIPLSITLDTDEDFEEPDVRYWLKQQ